MKVNTEISLTSLNITFTIISFMAAFAPEVLTHIGPLPITNTLIHTLIVDAILIGTAITVAKNLKRIPRGFQNVIETLIEGLYNLTRNIAPSQKAASAIFPFIATFFLFILVSNFTGLLPGVGTVGFFNNGASTKLPYSSSEAIAESRSLNSDSSRLTSFARTVIAAEETHTSEAGSHETTEEHETVPAHTEEKTLTEEHAVEEETHAVFTSLLRPPTSDINATLALSILSVIATHYLSIKITGFKDYISRYFSFNPVNLYIGILELVAEVMKVLSLSFRLFGNIFAGEVALHTISALFAFVAPLPFLLLESIVSVVQALVFSVLTLVFMSVLTTPHHAHEHKEVSH